MKRNLILYMLLFPALAFSQSPKEGKGKRVDIGLSTLQAVLQYLEARPFNEVNKLFQAVQEDARVISPVAPSINSAPPPITQVGPSFQRKMPEVKLTEAQKEQMKVVDERMKKLEEQRKKDVKNKKDGESKK